MEVDIAHLTVRLTLVLLDITHMVGVVALHHTIVITVLIKLPLVAIDMERLKQVLQKAAIMEQLTMLMLLPRKAIISNPN